MTGEWSAWGKYSACSKTCGTGSRTRKRVCMNGNECKCATKGPCEFEEECSKLSSQTTECNTQACPGMYIW